MADDCDVGMGANLDEFRGEDAHCTVIGGERLVQLRHPAADRRLALNEIGLDSHLCEVQSSLNAGDPTSDDCSGLMHRRPPISVRREPVSGVRRP